MRTLFFLVICALFATTALALVPAARVAARARAQQRLQMSSPDPLEEIRAKAKADPNYNPMQDPQAMQVLESMIPAEIKEIPNAVERLKVAIKDSSSGPNAVADLNKVAADFTGPKSDLISTPTSAWMKAGMPNENPSFSESLKNELKQKVKSANPDVPEGGP